MQTLHTRSSMEGSTLRTLDRVLTTTARLFIVLQIGIGKLEQKEMVIGD